MYTHDQLVIYAARYLRREHALVITEMSSGEEADAIGFMSGGSSTLIECKANRADFLRDKNKMWRRTPHLALGGFRWYLANQGIIKLDELPDNWGLLEVQKNRIYKIIAAKYQQHEKSKEVGLLISAIRRIGQNAPPGISVKFYTYQTQCRATLGVLDDTGFDVSGALGHGS